MSADFELVVVGAHMTGLSLNGELTSLGALFRRATSTAPAYRLFALPGGPPPRPGLLRVHPDEGAAVAVEVWALPAARVGDLLARVPPPLCLGTVLLADETAPKGFLVEAVATRGAEDITGHGGWRSFLAARRAAAPATRSPPE